MKHKKIHLRTLCIALVLGLLMGGFTAWGPVITAGAEGGDGEKGYDYSAIAGANTNGAVITGYEKALAVNVVDLGADSTGSRDSYQAIQKALDMAKDTASDKVQLKVIIPEGTYKISDHLLIYSNTWLYMPGATILRNYSQGYMLRNPLGDPGTGKAAYGYTGEHNIIIEGGCFDGNTASASTPFSNVRLGHCENIWIKDVEFRDNYSGHLLELGGARNVTIEGCEFHEYYGNTLKEAIQLDALNNATVFVSFEPFDDTTCENILIRNNRFHDLMRGFGSHSATLGVYFQNIVISGNTFDNIYDRAILMQNYRRTLISGNTFTSCGSGIDFKNMTLLESQGYYRPVSGLDGIYDRINDYSDTIIKDNKISVKYTGYIPEPYCIQLFGKNLVGSVWPDHDYKVKGVRIEGNTLNSPGTTVALYDTEGVLIKENKSSSEGGIEADQIIVRQSDKASVTGNTVSGGLYSGIYVGSGEGHSVTDNSCDGMGSSGIYLSLEAKDVAVKRNEVKNTSGSGIKVTRYASGKLEENTVTGCAAGLEFADGSGTVNSCTVKDSKGSGLLAQGDSQVTVKKSKVTGSGDYGIKSLEGAQVKLGENTVEDDSPGDFGGSGSILAQAPAKLMCDGIYQDHLQLSWEASPMADAYSVQRRTSGSEEGFYEIAQVYSTSCTDLGLSSRTRYEYRVEGIILAGENDYYGEDSDIISLRTKTDITDCTSDLEPVIRFSGKALTPAFDVYADGDLLVPGRDYTVRFSKNTAVGQASALVVGRGQYYGFKEFNFQISLTEGTLAETIRPRSLGQSTVAPLAVGTAETYQVTVVREPAPTDNAIYDSITGLKGSSLRIRRSSGPELMTL